MSEVIVFTSGKGGVGKSNLCLNTALQLTALQYRTCLFDGDLGLANVNILLGIDQEYTLDDVVFNDRSVDDILVHTGYGFDIIPGSSGVEQIANLSTDQLESLIGALKGVDAYDYFLIDTASGISRSVISFCMAARQTIIVITREATSLTDAYALLKILSVNGYQGSVRVLVNNCDSIPQAKSTYLRYKKVVDKHLDIVIAPAGIVLHDEHFERAVVQQKPLLEIYPDSIGSQCIKAFVANLVGEKGPAAEERGLARFWERYLQQISEQPRAAGGADNSSPPTGEAQPDQVFAQAPLASAAVPEFSHALFVSASYLPGAGSCPSFLAAILSRLNQGAVSLENIRRLICVDPALMFQALGLVPLAETAPQGHIPSLDQIIGSLKDEDIEPMLLQAAVRSAGAAANGGATTLQAWLRSYRCAVLAREIGQAASFAFPDEAYLAALLLDIGSGVESLDHAAAGADLLQSAGFNSMICDAVRFHHHPPSQVRTAFTLVRIVYAAHALVYQTEGEDGIDLFDDVVELPEEQVLELLDKTLQITARTAAFLELDISDKAADAAEDGRNGSLATYLLDNLLTRAMMPPLKASASRREWARQLQRSCRLLAGVGAVICFVADAEGEKLGAVGAGTSAYAEQFESISVAVDNSTSLVSTAFISGSARIGDLSDESSLNLGDRQLGRLLGGRTMICVPLKTGSETVGVVVCTSDSGAAGLDRQVGILLTVGARAAEDLAVTV